MRAQHLEQYQIMHNSGPDSEEQRAVNMNLRLRQRMEICVIPQKYTLSKNLATPSGQKRIAALFTAQWKVTSLIDHQKHK